MRIKKNEILFIYHSGNHKEKEAFAYVKALKHFQARVIDLKNESLTPTQIERVAAHCNYGLDEMIDNKAPSFSDLSGSKMSHKDLLTQLSENPKLINTPFALWHNGGKRLENKFEIVTEDLALNKKPVKRQHQNVEQ